MSQKMRIPDVDSGNTMTAESRLTQAGALSVVAPALAMDLTDQLAAGLAVNIWNDDLTQNSSYRKHYLLMDQQAGLGMAVDEEYTVQRGYSYVLGTLYRVNKEWSLAAVIKPPFTLRGQKTRHYFDYADPNWTQTGSSAFASTLSMPLVLGGGVAWRPSDPLTVALDVTWTDWSEFTMRDKGKLYNPISNAYLSKGRCEDAYTVRLGTEYVVPRRDCQIPLRCGVGYDPQPGIAEVVNYYTANLGAGIQWARYALDAAYEARWGHDVHTGAFPSRQITEDILQHRILISLILYL